jgi:hypothetical protein
MSFNDDTYVRQEGGRSMKDIERIFDYRFPNAAWPVAVLGVRLGEIAKRLSVEVESWSEDGLGKVNALVLFPSSRVVVLHEYEHLVQGSGLKGGGPEVSFDVADVVEFGIKSLVDEVLEVLGLTYDFVVWIGPEAARDRAAELLKVVKGNAIR